MQVPYALVCQLEALVSCKGVRGNSKSEGSRTTKVGSNEQELDTEAIRVWMSKHIIVKSNEHQKALIVDQVDIDGKNLLLPGEILTLKR